MFFGRKNKPAGSQGTANVPRFPHQWYNQNPARYEQEKRLMLEKCAAMSPVEVQLPDGRRGFRLTVKVPDPEGSIRNPDGSHSKAYQLMLVWHGSHPATTDKLYGGSVSTYFVSPTVDEVKADFLRHGRTAIPHMLRGVHPVTGAPLSYPCTARQEDTQPETFTIVEAVGLAYNWLTQYTAAKYSDVALQIMQQH